MIKNKLLLKIIYINNNCTDFMFLVVMLWVTLSSAILSLIIFILPLLVFKTFLCGSTLVKVSLLQAGTVVI